MKKVELKCFDLDINNGQGLCKYQGKTISVNNMLPKEVGIVEIDEDRKYNKYKLVKILKKSNNRVDDGCSIYSKCGSCHLLHMDYESQIEYKKNYVSYCLKKEKLDGKIDMKKKHIELFHLKTVKYKLKIKMKFVKLF